MRLRLVGLICCSMSLTSSVAVNAQGVQVRDGKVALSGFGDVDIERTLEFWERQERAQSQERLMLHVAAIRSECHIDDEAVRKLEVSAKKVITERLRKGRRNGAVGFPEQKL